MPIPLCPIHGTQMWLKQRYGDWSKPSDLYCPTCVKEEQEAFEKWHAEESPKWIAAAREMEEENLLIPPDPQCDIVEGGAYVQAWVWVAEEALPG